MPNAPGMTLSLHVRESKTVLDSGSHAVDSGSRYGIPKSSNPDTIFKNFTDSKIQIPSHGVGFRSFKVSEVLSEAIKHQTLNGNLVPRSPKHFFFQNCNTTQRLIMQTNNGELANHFTQ